MDTTSLSAICDPSLIDVDKLIYDLSNCAYIEGHLLGDDDEHIRHVVMDICEDGNIDRVADVVGIAQSQVRRAIGSRPVDQGARALIHEYVLASVLADWFSITLPSAAPVWLSKATTALSSLSSPFTRRLPPW